MKIGILETGLINDKIKDKYPPYPTMFATLLDLAEADLDYQGYCVIEGKMPSSIHECDGWLITGSRHGVYEKLDWMLTLDAFIRDLYQAGVPLVGICFGHQIIAEALGGKVELSDKGWGVGAHRYRIDQPQDWMKSHDDEISIYAFHQDQVSQLPPQATVFSSSQFCPYAGLSYGDSVISLQAHPEFEAQYELALLNMYSGNILPSEVADAAIAGMQSGARADTLRLSEWLAEFFLSRHQRRNRLNQAV